MRLGLAGGVIDGKTRRKFRTPASHTRRASHRLSRPAFEKLHRSGLVRRSKH